MKVKIYKFDLSAPARAVLMTTELLKLNVELQDVILPAGQNMSPEYLEKNPLHTVPLLEDGDFLLADSHAIITYLVSKYGAEKKAELYPSELTSRAIIDQRMFFDTSILFPALRKIAGEIMTTGSTSATKEQLEEVNAGYVVLEKYLQKTKFVAGDHLTVADVSCVASISALAALVPVDAKYTKLNEWWNTLQQEKWYQKGNLPGLNMMIQFLEAKWNSK